MASFQLTDEARGDLDEIWDYIAVDSAVSADRLLDRLEEQFDLLAEQPLIGRAREDLAAGLRSFTVGNYLISIATGKTW
ncbi:hypothetical protein BH24DEI1_BH24DEI1_18700 [soil metagenome]|jgi:toxin ParE1/3/4|nr:type II toxin-antitoxin system RelE/ParE family toxin [Deinococcota bacterium]